MPRVAKQPQPPLGHSGRPLLVLRNPLPRQTFSASQLNNRPLVYSAVELILLRPRLLVLLVLRILLSLPLQLRPPCSAEREPLAKHNHSKRALLEGERVHLGRRSSNNPNSRLAYSAVVAEHLAAQPISLHPLAQVSH